MGKELEIHLHTNNTCNLRCKHCYNNSGQFSTCVMPAQRVIEIINYACSHYDAQFHIEGGEIFLLPDLLSKMNVIKEEYLKRITITTNGTIQLKDPEILNMLSKIGALRISVEGSDDIMQMSLRGIGIRQVLDSAAFYQNCGAETWLRITLNKINYPMFVNDTLISLIDQGFENLQVYEFQAVGRGARFFDRFALDHSLFDLFVTLCKYADRIKGNLKMMFSKGREAEVLSYKNELEKAGYSVMLIQPERGVSIRPNGEVFVCPWDNDMDHRIINLNHHEISDAFHILDTKDLMHQCPYCSSVRITREGNKNVT